MSLTLLIDLDDTLLDNDIDKFLPAYLKALGKHLSNSFSPDRLVPELLTATRKMIENQDPAITLEQAFDRAFYPALGTTKEDLREAIHTFYDEIFPTLQPLTAMRPEAVRLVDNAVARGYQVVVATNPLFPRQAIFHRLAWAGLPVEHYPFAKITTYEDFHFTKPRPEYYAEILAQLGWPNQPAVMVGNSLNDDILPASQLGLPTFWLNPASGQKAVPGTFSRQGNLADVLPWADQIAAQASSSASLSRTALLANLRSTPAALKTIVKDLAVDSWSTSPAPGEWSISQIFCHLRDVDTEVNYPRLEKICSEENPFLPGINTDLWAEERSYHLQDGLEALDSFVQIRSKLINTLIDIPEESWSRTARHAIFGPTKLSELIGFITTHDRTHIQQVLENIRNR